MSYTWIVRKILSPDDHHRYVDYASVSIMRPTGHVATIEIACYELAHLLGLETRHQFRVNDEFSTKFEVVAS